MTRRALVVDDDRSMVKTLADVLQLQGWEVERAYSGAAAVQVAIHQDFDVVLMDVKMPGIDGVDAFRAMKKARPHIRVVLMTAYAAPERLSAAEAEGVLRVMSKPVDMRELLALLATMLDGDRPVLLIDHDTSFLRSLTDMLSAQGFEVASAEDLDHATALMNERRPIAVMLHLEGGAREMRDAVAAVHDANPAAAIILYGEKENAHAEVRRAVPDEWVHAYLQKPFAIEQVTEVLEGLRNG